MNWLLDTNVISQQTIGRPNADAMRFLATLPQEQAFLSVINLMEIRDGIERLDPATRRHAHLETWLTKKLPETFTGRILPIISEIADSAGRLLAAERGAKRTPDKADVLLAATAKHFGMGVATLSRKHFEPLGIPIAEF